MSKVWTYQEKAFLKELLNEKKEAQEIFESMTAARLENKSGFSVPRSLRAIKGKISDLADEPEEDEEASYKLELAEIKKVHELYRESGRIVDRSGRLGKDGGRLILSLSDLHIPFCDPERIEGILSCYREELRDGGIIVLNGDIMDQYGASCFTKYKEINLVSEYRAAFELVQKCCEIASKVVLVKGNHESRLSRLVRDKLPTSALSILETDLLAKIAKGEIISNRGDLVGINEKVKSRVVYQYAESWYARVGKTIFCHPSGYNGSYPGGTVIKAFEYFRGRYGDEFNSVVCGHTHHLYKGVVEGYLLIEQGALVGRLGYEGGPDLKTNHSQNGYAVIRQNSANGLADFNYSDFVSLGSAVPRLKPIL